MKTPYELLNVATDAGDAEIKRAYLQQVKDNPPDRYPEQFQAIYNAYEAIKDNKSRLSHALFNAPAADFDALLDQAFDSTQTFKLSPEQFDKLLLAGVDDQALLKAIPFSDKL